MVLAGRGPRQSQFSHYGTPCEPPQRDAGDVRKSGTSATEKIQLKKTTYGSASVPGSLADG